MSRFRFEIGQTVLIENTVHTEMNGTKGEVVTRCGQEGKDEGFNLYRLKVDEEGKIVFICAEKYLEMG